MIVWKRFPAENMGTNNKVPPGSKSIEVDRSVYRARPVYERTPP